MIKPDAVKRNLIGEILNRIEKADFKIVDLKMTELSIKEAERFYEVHRGKDFFERLVNYMASGKIVVALLQKENAVEDLRDFIGVTDPKEAKKGSIRSDFGLDITRNSVHASDSSQNAKLEIEFFF